MWEATDNFGAWALHASAQGPRDVLRGPGDPPRSPCEHKAPRPRAMGQSVQALNPLHESCSFVPRTRDDPGAPHVGGEGCVSGAILERRTAGIRVVEGVFGGQDQEGGLAAPPTWL